MSLHGISEEELKALEANPATAAVAKKLKESTAIPYERFKEVNEEAKAARERLAQIEKEKEDASRKALEEQGKFKELAEKQAAEIQKQKEMYEAKIKDLEPAVQIATRVAEQEKAAREEAKKALGDFWLPVYEHASAEELRKIQEQVLGKERQSPDRSRPKPNEEGKAFSEMTAEEREAFRTRVLSGKEVRLPKL